MLKKHYVIITAVLMSVLFFSNISNAVGPDIEGTWMGGLKIPTGEILIVFKITKDQNGSLTATMDSPDQGATNLPVSKVTFENNKLLLESKLIGGSFEGTLKADGSFDGLWKQSGLSLPLVLKKTEEAPKINRPQEPKKPYPYIEEEITCENSGAGVKLAGTLTIPRSDKPCSAVILISGSGAEDRDETIFGHKPFLILADYLTRKGIAVLRTDDRGVGGSTGDVMSSTSEDFAGDVIAQVNYLKTRKEIDWTKIGLIGHSEGGIITPIAAVKSPDVSFIVLMAGTGLTGEDIIYLQSDMILKKAGASEKIQNIQKETLKNIFNVIKNEKDASAIEAKAREILNNTLDKLDENEKAVLKATFDAQLKAITSQWFRYFVTYDPKPTLKKVRCAVLALNGSLDLQVASKENLAAIEGALKEGGNKNYTVKELPGLNHLFQKAKTGALTEYSMIEETISPDALEIISNWVLEQTEK